MRIRELLGTPVSGASLAAFRGVVGLVMTLEAWTLGRPNPAAISTGASPLETYYTGGDIRFHLPYNGFEWLPLFPPAVIYGLVAVQAVSGLMVAAGYCYRLAAPVLFLSWAYFFLVESTRTYWQSHYYLELLVTFLMVWMPAARCYSVDAWRDRGRGSLRTVPYWTLVVLRGQLVIAYFYAGVAKINLDWLLDAVPVRWFLAHPAVTTPYEPYLSSSQLAFIKGILHSAGFAYFISYTGLLFDLAIGFLLLVRRTRVFGMILMVMFHATNLLIIFDDISWFPLLGVTTASIFLDADWPERFWRWIRRPRVIPPDWAWLAAGALLFPGVGAALGWSLKPSAAPTKAKNSVPIRKWVAPSVGVWLVCQTLLPIRHYWIGGDARMTYEGLSFSWRLKADVRMASGAQLIVNDPVILPVDGSGRARIDWSAWHGDKVIYREVSPGRVDWTQLPEVLIQLQPIAGERILYNPAAATATGRTETEAEERIRSIWRERYGRAPEKIHRTSSLTGVLGTAAAKAKERGHWEGAARIEEILLMAQQLDRNAMGREEAMSARGKIRGLLERVCGDPSIGTMVREELARMDPFLLEGERRRPYPFFVIEDRNLIRSEPTVASRVDRQAWRRGFETRSSHEVGSEWVDGEPMLIYLGFIGADEREMMPAAYLLQFQHNLRQVPSIRWNVWRDLTPSKNIHISNQAFYLRRYARRVADGWAREYGRRPAVHALTSVSLNGRPHQPLVEFHTDLASVGLTWFGHNAWIKDLETERIPRRALVGAAGMIRP